MSNLRHHLECVLGVFSWVLLITACKSAKPLPDIGILNATRYPAVAVNEATVEAMKAARPTTAPTPTKSPLDMIATDPDKFQLKSGHLQFVEFFRYG